MGVFAGPETVEDGLVLALDAGNTKGYDKYENIILQSNSPDNLLSSWGKGPNTTRVGNVIAPDETLTGIGYTGDGSGGNIFVNQTVNLSANTTYTCSIWAKLISGSVPTAGTIISATYHNGTALARSTVNYNNNLTSEWKRFSTTFTNVDAQTGVSMFFIADQNNTSQIAIWGAQLERGESLTDYYATTGTAKTRGSVVSSGIGTLTGTLTNGVGYDNVNGGSFTFDGVNDYISVPNVAALGANDFSFELWFKTAGTGTWQYFFSNKNNFSGPFTRIGINQTTNQLRFYTEQTDQTNAVGLGVATVTDDVWHHAVFTRSGTVGNIYLDGALDATVSTMGGDIGNDVDDWIIGLGSAGGSQGLGGEMGEFRFYPRALTASEIKQNFVALRSRFGI